MLIRFAKRAFPLFLGALLAQPAIVTAQSGWAMSGGYPEAKSHQGIARPFAGLFRKPARQSTHSHPQAAGVMARLPMSPDANPMMAYPSTVGFPQTSTVHSMPRAPHGMPQPVYGTSGMPTPANPMQHGFTTQQVGAPHSLEPIMDPNPAFANHGLMPPQTGTQLNPFVTPHGIPASANAIQATPVDAAVMLIREATEYEQAGRFSDAKARYESALATQPHHWQALVGYARLLHRQGDIEGAITTYQKVLSIYPKDRVAMNDLGLCYARYGDLPKAIEVLQSAVALEPQSKRYRNNLATVLIETNKLNDALAHLQDVHGEAIGEFNMGYLLSQRGRNEEASEHLRVALHLDPSLAPARELLAKVMPDSLQIATRPSAALSVGSQHNSSDAGGTILLQSGELELGTESEVRSADFSVLTTVPSRREEAPTPDRFSIPGMDE